MKYHLYLKNQKVRVYRQITALLIALNAIFLTYIFFYTDLERITKFFFIICILSSSLYLFFQIVEWLNKKAMSDTWHRSVFSISSLAWFKTAWWWIGLLFLFFVLMDYLSTRKMVVAISQKNILYPSFPQKSIQWDELSNVILKDGLLTIDFKSNKLIQQAILNSDRDVNEAEFNKFCEKQLKAHTNKAATA